MSPLRNWFEATRPKTLSAAFCPVLVGSSLALEVRLFDWRPASICLIFALLVQIGTNFANDYLDGIKGTDTKERLGPRRAVASGLIPAKAMRLAAVLTLSLAFCLGLLLIPFGGWWLLVVGICSVAFAWLYTGGPYPLAYNGLGDVFVILFFGLVAVGCTFYVQAGTISSEAILLGLACGMVVNNILVVNNYRDFEEDRTSGKRTLVVLLGRRFARGQYLATLLVAGAITCTYALSQASPGSLLALIPLFAGLSVFMRLKTLSSFEDYLWALKRSGFVVVLYGFFLSFGIALS